MKKDRRPKAVLAERTGRGRWKRQEEKSGRWWIVKGKKYAAFFVAKLASWLGGAEKKGG